MLALAISVPLSPRPPVALSAQITTTDILSGQELIYRGRFGAAQVYFADLGRQYPREPVGPTLEAAALIWWGEAQNDETFQADSIDLLLTEAVARAQARVDSAADDSSRAGALFWLATAIGYRARQADVRGSSWRAAQDAKAMKKALERAIALDSTCVDCLIGLGAYDYGLARASGLMRFVARLIGLGSGDVNRALERMRRVSESGTLMRYEARWVYGNALLREGEKDPSLREEGLRVIADLATQFPENPVFRRPVPPASGVQ